MSNEPNEGATARLAVRSLIDGLRPHDAEEADHRDDALAWIDSGAPIFRTAKPATPPKHLVSYCLLVDSEARKALLVDHRDAERWLPTGGHVEVDEHPVAAAEREMEEELGIRPAFHPATGPAPLFLTVNETSGQSRPHTDVSLWFILSGSEADELEPDAGEFAGAHWWSFDDIGTTDGVSFDEHLPRCLAKLERLG